MENNTLQLVELLAKGAVGTQKQIARAWNMDVNTYIAGAPILVTQNCFAFMFTNIGDTIATVNGMVIYPGVPGTRLGDSRSVGAHLLDLYKGNITLKFLPVGGETDPNVEIVQLYYAEAYDK